MHTSCRCQPCLAGPVVLGWRPHSRLPSVLQLGLLLLASLSTFPALDCSPASAEQKLPCKCNEASPLHMQSMFWCIQLHQQQQCSGQEHVCSQITWPFHDRARLQLHTQQSG